MKGAGEAIVPHNQSISKSNHRFGCLIHEHYLSLSGDDDYSYRGSVQGFNRSSFDQSALGYLSMNADCLL